ncbi:MAG: hypothetical protein WBD50_05300 [Candidatus Rhabdochlamydia sp.]
MKREWENSREYLSNNDFYNGARKDMTIRVSINSDFHRSVCPTKENNPNPQNCSNKEMKLDYRCSKCVSQCLKCEAFRLNTCSPYARGCEEARRVVIRTFSCVCVQSCDV